jgi:hypothetical protein
MSVLMGIGILQLLHQIVGVAISLMQCLLNFRKFGFELAIFLFSLFGFLFGLGQLRFINLLEP